MAGTAAAAIKRALYNALVARAGEGGDLSGWQIQYVVNAKSLGRRAVVLGKLTFADTSRVVTGAQRRPRDERITLAASIRAYEPGGNQPDLDDEVVAALAVLEEMLATRNLPDLPTGISFAGIDGEAELDYWQEDAGIASVLDFTAYFTRPYKR